MRSRGLKTKNDFNVRSSSLQVQKSYVPSIYKSEFTKEQCEANKLISKANYNPMQQFFKGKSKQRENACNQY